PVRAPPGAVAHLFGFGRHQCHLQLVGEHRRRGARRAAVLPDAAVVAAAGARHSQGAADAQFDRARGDGAGRRGAGPVPGRIGRAGACMASSLCLQYGAARLSAAATAVVMPCEVLFAALTSVWWGGATLHAGVLAGGALILAATLASVLEKR